MLIPPIGAMVVSVAAPAAPAPALPAPTNGMIIMVERTILGALYQVLASKKTLTAIGGFITTAITWILSFIAMHLGGEAKIKPEILALIPIMAGVLSTGIISGMIVVIHALGKQDDGKEAAAITAASVKDAAKQGLAALIQAVETEAPGLIAKIMAAQLAPPTITELPASPGIPIDPSKPSG